MKAILPVVFSIGLYLTCSGAGAQDVTVRIVGPGPEAKFEPNRVEVEVGQTVRWVNEGNMAHTASTEKRHPPGSMTRLFDTNSIPRNGHKDIKFDETLFMNAGGQPGGTVELTYICKPHPQMRAATIVLKDPRDAEEPAENRSVIVPHITEIKLSIQTSDPPRLVIEVKGEVPTGGYTQPTLVPAIYISPPADGYQDYYFAAIPPDGPATTAITPISARAVWTNYTNVAPWLKGIRVHGVAGGTKEQPLP